MPEPIPGETPTNNPPPADDGGTGGQPQIDWNTIDPASIPVAFFERISGQLPDTVVKSTKLYKDVLQESIERRQKIRELVQDKKPDEGHKPDIKPEGSDEVLRQVLEKLTKLEQRDNETLKQAILAKHKVPSDYLSFVSDDDLVKMEEKTAAFAKSILPLIQKGSGISPGQGEPIDQLEGIAKRLQDKIEGKHTLSDALSLEGQMRLGGGPLIIKP